MLCECRELRKKERVVGEKDGFAVVVPSWTVWAFEMIVPSKRHVAATPEHAAQHLARAGGLHYLDRA